MGRYGLLQEISSHTASRQSQGLHRVRLCLARLRCAHASVVLTNKRGSGAGRRRTLDALLSAVQFKPERAAGGAN